MQPETKLYTFDEFDKEHTNFHGDLFISPVNDPSLLGYSVRLGIITYISRDCQQNGFYIKLREERLLINGKARTCCDKEMHTLSESDFPGIKEDHQIVLKNGCRLFLK